MRSYSSGGTICSAAISTPQPTGTRRKVCSASAPRDFAKKFEHYGKLVRIEASDGGINLHRHAEILQVAGAGDGGVEGSGMPLKLSCVISSAPSRLMATRCTPLSTIMRGLFADQSSDSGERDAQAFFGAVTRVGRYPNNRVVLRR